MPIDNSRREQTEPAAFGAGALTGVQDEPAAIAWIRKHSLLLFVGLVLLGSVRIVSTYHVFSHTYDEPNHIAAGIEWLNDGALALDYSHPPLARIAAALGPWLASGRSAIPPFTGDPALVKPTDLASPAGLAILHRNGDYDRNLALARLGILPFFWVACLTVYLWCRRYLGEPATVFAVFLYSFLPSILAHAGLATTDMALTAFAGASFLATMFWLQAPGLRSGLVLGTITGLAVLSKFSALVFIPVSLLAACLVCIVMERPRFSSKSVGKYAVSLFIALLTVALVVWAGYRFTTGPMTTRGFHLWLPAPELFRGLRDLFEYNQNGHTSFLLGSQSHKGWWYFFLVVLAVKTPLPFLLLTFFGAFAVWKKRGVWLALAFSLGILLFALTSHLDLGVRHILPVYTGFAVVAGAGAERLLTLARKTMWAGWFLGALLGWMVVTSGLSHPNYLPYFNALAGDKPENVLVESDLDWGQDLERLSKRLREKGASSVAFDAYNPADLPKMGFPLVTPTSIESPTVGWNAVSVTNLKLLLEDKTHPLPWQQRIPPQERIGKGIWLWYFPPNSAQGK